MTDGNQTINGNKSITGNTLITGSATSLNSTQTSMSESVLYMNNSYTSTTAVSAGIIVNYQATATTDTIATGGFTAGTIGVTNATCKTTGAATFTIGDIIQITSASNITNNGIFEVQSHAANTLTIKGGSSANAIAVFQQNFVTDTTVSGNITKVNIGIKRMNGATGFWEQNVGGSTTTGMTMGPILAPLTGGPGSIRVFRDEKANGTTPGTSILGAANFTNFTTRVLNTSVGNMNGTSLASNLMTVPIGTYKVTLSVPYALVGITIARLRDTTNNVVLTLTPSGQSNNASVVSQLMTTHFITVANANNTIAVEQWCGTAGGVLGKPASAGVTEIYTVVVFNRLT
jgi:hypothetical protein